MKTLEYINYYMHSTPLQVERRNPQVGTNGNAVQWTAKTPQNHSTIAQHQDYTAL